MTRCVSDCSHSINQRVAPTRLVSLIEGYDLLMDQFSIYFVAGRSGATRRQSY